MEDREGEKEALRWIGLIAITCVWAMILGAIVTIVMF